MIAFSTIVAAFAIGQSAATISANSAVQRKNGPVLPTVAEIYDPIEGPFIIRLSAKDEVGPEQDGVIANAVRSWSGEHLQSFQICFSTRGPVNWKSYNLAMNYVAGSLKSKGARVVTMPNGGLCRSAHRLSIAGAYIEINGVVVL